MPGLPAKTARRIYAQLHGRPAAPDVRDGVAGDGPRRVGPAAAWRVLRQRDFGPYFVGNASSASGTWFQNLAASLLVYRLTHSAFLLGVLNFAHSSRCSSCHRGRAPSPTGSTAGRLRSSRSAVAALTRGARGCSPGRPRAEGRRDRIRARARA